MNVSEKRDSKQERKCTAYFFNKKTDCFRIQTVERLLRNRSGAKTFAKIKKIKQSTMWSHI